MKRDCIRRDLDMQSFRYHRLHKKSEDMTQSGHTCECSYVKVKCREMESTLGIFSRKGFHTGVLVLRKFRIDCRSTFGLCLWIKTHD